MHQFYVGWGPLKLQKVFPYGGKIFSILPSLPKIIKRRKKACLTPASQQL